MIQGTVYKAYGGYYFVDDGTGKYRCYLRGRLNLKNERVLVGDRVNITVEKDGTGVIESLEPRSTRLYRPPVANINIAVIVFSLARPEPNLGLLDRFLIQAEVSGVKPVICLNKMDLKSPEEICSSYQKAGYTVITTSVLKQEGIDELAGVLKDNISVFAGPSGAGKSSLLNAIQPGFSLKTGELSGKLKKGKHTTRHVELLQLQNGGMVVDTPGFSNLYLPDGLTSYDLACFFPDIHQFAGNCRFNSCLHYKEPGCGVKKAVQEETIVPTRYKHYITLLEQLMKQERR